MIGWDAFRSVFPDAQIASDGGDEVVVIPSLAFDSNGQEYKMLAVLVPALLARLGGYTTRLLLDAPTTKSVNWTTVTLLGRSWATWSFNNVPPDIPLLEILGNHLKDLA